MNLGKNYKCNKYSHTVGKYIWSYNFINIILNTFVI